MSQIARQSDAEWQTAANDRPGRLPFGDFCDPSVVARPAAVSADDGRIPGPVVECPAQDAVILIVDDEPVNIKVVRKYLAGAGYRNFLDTSDATQAIPLTLRGTPDLVILDVMMPKVSGFDVLSAMRSDPQFAHVPVLVLTASDDRETKLRALELGATDFLAKPVDPSELIPRVRNCLLVKAHQDHLRGHAEQLERQVQERTAELEASRRNVIYCLARAAEFRDDETGRHVVRVGCYAGVIARQLGWTESQAALLEQAAQLHDVGKIGIPDDVLLKPGKLTPDEFEMVQKHCGFGKRIFEPMTNDQWCRWQDHTEVGRRIIGDTKSPILEMASRIALTHHERWDGSGYPLGLVGEDIPREGRITAVADVFDALSTKRAYKPAFAIDRCFTILEEGRGTHFDPEVLDAFLSARNEILKVQLRYAEVD